jgi:hypothetical protein
MPQALSAPEVVRCYFDESFDPHLPAMCLRWDPDDAEQTERLWELPEGVCVVGPPPRRFGVSIRRQGADSYAVRLLWDRTCFTWLALARVQLWTSALAPLLASLGTDLWYLLDQPASSGGRSPRRAA